MRSCILALENISLNVKYVSKRNVKTVSFVCIDSIVISTNESNLSSNENTLFDLVLETIVALFVNFLVS